MPPTLAAANRESNGSARRSRSTSRTSTSLTGKSRYASRRTNPPTTVIMPVGIAKKLNGFVRGRTGGPVFCAGNRRESMRHAQRGLSNWIVAAAIQGRSPPRAEAHVRDRVAGVDGRLAAGAGRHEPREHRQHHDLHDGGPGEAEGGGGKLIYGICCRTCSPSFPPSATPKWSCWCSWR